MSTLPRFGVTELAASQAIPETTVNENLRYVSQGAGHFVFIDRDLTAPPGSPVDGDCYLVGTGGTGAWSGHDGDIAFYLSSAWAFIEPLEGFTAGVQDENAAIAFLGGSWTALATGGAYTDEQAQDAVGTILTDTGLAVVTYNDGAPSIDINVPAAVASDYRTGTDATKALTSDGVWDAADYVTLNDSGGNIAVDMSTGFNFAMTMDGDYTLSNPTNTKNGQSGCIVLTQDGTGNQTLAYGSNWKFAGGTDPVLSTAAGAVDVLFYQVISSTVIVGNLVKAIA